MEVFMPHRFIYGRPVRPDEFINRENELSTLFNRLRSCESTAIVGEPHIGKTSLLRKLADPHTQRKYIDLEVENIHFNFIDLHPIEDDYSPKMFWEEALERILAHSSDIGVSSQLKECSEANYSRATLRRLFRKLAQGKIKLVLLLDEFERLLTHPNLSSSFLLCRTAVTGHLNW